MSKVKGIKAWELYIEYAVLGAVALIALAFVALQFVGEPNAVEVTGKGAIAPRDIDDRLRDEAQRIESRLAPDVSPPFDLPEYSPVLARLIEQFESDISPIDRLPLAWAYVPPGTGERIDPDAIFVEPSVPTPTSVVAQQYFDGIIEEEVSQNPDLRDLLGEEPYDVTWNTVAALFPSGEWLRQLSSPGEQGHDRTPVPQSWHNDRATIVDVRVERETLVGGQWQDRVTLEPIPGQLSFRDTLRGNDVDATTRDTILRQLREISGQREVIQPEFYRTRTRTWMPPDPYLTAKDFDADEAEQIERLQRRLANYIRQREQIQRELDGGGRPGGEQPPAGGGRGGGGLGGGRGGGGSLDGGLGGGRGGGGSGGLGGGERGGPGQTPPRRTDSARLQQQLERINQLIEGIEEQLRVLRPDAEFDPERLPIEEAEEIIIWAHDLSIEPGSIYRYRVIVDLYNPFFARRLNLVDEQQHLADQFDLRSEPSEWSEPIQARPPVHTFITRANAPGQDQVIGQAIDVGSVRAEVFRFYDGRWWAEQFTVEAGQRIGGVRQVRQQDDPDLTIDFGTEWLVLDVIRNLDISRDDGRAAKVVLQNMIDDRTIEIRQPSDDIGSALRQQLRAEIELIASR